MSAQPIVVGDLVRFATGSVLYRVTAMRFDGELVDLIVRRLDTSAPIKRRRMVATSRLVRLGR